MPGRTARQNISCPRRRRATAHAARPPWHDAAPAGGAVRRLSSAASPRWKRALATADTAAARNRRRAAAGSRGGHHPLPSRRCSARETPDCAASRRHVMPRRARSVRSRAPDARGQEMFRAHRPARQSGAGARNPARGGASLGGVRTPSPTSGPERPVHHVWLPSAAFADGRRATEYFEDPEWRHDRQATAPWDALLKPRDGPTYHPPPLQTPAGSDGRARGRQVPSGVLAGHQQAEGLVQITAIRQPVPGSSKRLGGNTNHLVLAFADLKQIDGLHRIVRRRGA